MKRSLTVLIIDDSEEDAGLILQELQRSYDVEFERVETSEAMYAVLPEKNWDLILSDYNLPKFSALRALEVLNTSGLDVPFIIISGSVGDELAVGALKAGAHEFILKDNLERLQPAIEKELIETWARRSRRAEQAQQNSEELFGTAFQHSPVGICITTLDGELQNASQSLVEMLGYTQTELEGKHFNDITHPDDLEFGKEAVDRMMSGEVPSVSFEKRYLHKSGEPISALVSSSLLRDASGQPVHFITHIFNMTERKQAEEELRLSEERFSKAFYVSPAGLTITRIADGKFIDVNDAFLRMFEFSRTEVIGHTSTELNILSPEERAKLIQAQLESGGLRHAELQARSKAGRIVNILFSSKPIELEGEPHHVTTMIDITERKQAEEQTRAQAMRLKVLADASQTFAGTVYDYQEMLEMVARQTAEVLDGFCGVRLLSEDGEWLEMVAMHDVDAEALEFVRRLASQPLPADEPNVDQRVLQSHQPLLMPGVSEDQLRPVVRPEDWAHLKYIASQSRVLAPIRTRSQALGILVISRKVGSPAFDENDLSLAQDLADRAGLAISNARLFRQVQNELAERQRTNQQLRYQARLLENVNDAIVVADANYVLQAWNQAAEKIYGWAAEEVIGKNGIQILQTEFSAGNSNEIRKQVAELGHFFGEATQLRKDGERIVVEIATMAVRDDAGQNTAYVSVVRDITKRKQAEEALRESEERFSKAFYQSPIGIVLVDLTDFTIRDINQSLLDMTGFTRDEVINKSSLLINLQVDPDKRAKIVQDLQEHGFYQNQEIQLGVPNGEILSVLYSGVRVMIGGRPHNLALIQDLTERKQAEEAVLESEARYHRVLDAMMEGCQIIDFDWRYVYVNDVVVAQGKETREELLNHTMMEVYPGIENSELFTILRQCMEERTPRRMENQFVYPDGSIGWFELSIQPALEGIFILSSDITERKRAEEAVRLNEQRFRALTENSWDSVALFGADATILYGSPSTPQILGYELDEFVGRNAFELIHKDDQAFVTERLTRSLQKPGEHVSVYARVLHKNGSWRWLEGTFTNLLNEPSVKAIVNNYHDFTERKEAEEKIRQSEENFSKAFVSSPTALMITRRTDGKYLEINEAYISIVGYNRSELIGHLTTEFNIFINPDQRKEIVTQLLENGSLLNYEAQIQNKSGELRTVLASLEQIQFNGEDCILSTLVDITERKQAEERFRLAVESAPNAILLVNREGIIEMVNSQTENFFGYSRGQLIGLGVEQLVPERFRGIHPDHRKSFLDDPQIRSMGVGRDLHGVRKDGSEFSVEIGLAPIETSTGLLVMATIVDITERKQATEQFYLAVESAPNAIVLVNRDGTISLVNSQAENFFGYHRAELIGLNIDRLVPERFRGKHAEYREGFLADPQIRSMGIGRDLHALRKDGSEFPVEIGLTPIETRDGLLIMATIVDITERKQAEERNRFLANLVANVSDAIIAVDMQQNIQSWNNGAESLYGWKEQEVLGRPSKDILDTDFIGMPREAVTKQIVEQGSWSGEALQLHRDGTRIPVQSSVALYKDSEGRLAGIVAVNRDITERKRAEAALQSKSEEVRNMSQQLWQAAKLATMGELAASIAHELNNPLGTISLRTEMLQSQFTPDDTPLKSLNIIESEVSRMSSLVANLLQFSRRSSSQVSTIHVNEEVVNTLELIQYHLRKNSILTIQELSPDVSLIHADRQQLRQVFLNLFTNAADAMPLGGMLTIRTWSGEKPDTGITAPLRRSATQSLGLPAPDVPQVFIEVSDTGEGIPPEKLERVWEAFYTTKPEGKGTGLGLAICRRIMQEHGGTIDISSDGIPGKGTTVRLSLPAVKER